MRWTWDVYVLRGLPNIYSLSLYLLSLPLYLCTPAVAPWRCTWRQWSSVFDDALGDRDHVNSEMHFGAVIEQVWRFTWRPRSSGLRDALESHVWTFWEIHLEAMIEQDFRSTWRRLMWKLMTWRRSIWRQSIWSSESGGGRSGGMCDGSWDSIHWLTCDCGSV